MTNYDGYCRYTDGKLAMDTVPDADRYYRCSMCNKRLWPAENEFRFYLPSHKPKGHKIAKIKATQHRIRKNKCSRDRSTKT